MHTTLRAAVIVVSVMCALIPVVAFFSQADWVDWSSGVMGLAAFIVLFTPHMPVVLTGRYEPVTSGRLIGLLLCVLTFGLVPALFLSLFVIAGRGGGLAYALLLFLGSAIMLLIQLFVFAIAARIARGRTPMRNTPAYFRWV